MLQKFGMHMTDEARMAIRRHPTRSKRIGEIAEMRRCLMIGHQLRNRSPARSGMCLLDFRVRLVRPCLSSPSLSCPLAVVCVADGCCHLHFYSHAVFSFRSITPRPTTHRQIDRNFDSDHDDLRAYTTNAGRTRSAFVLSDRQGSTPGCRSPNPYPYP